MSDKDRKEAIYLRLQGKVKERFKAIKNFLALENDTEVCRMLINDYYMRNRDDLEPKLRHFYTNKKGLLIADQT